MLSSTGHPMQSCFLHTAFMSLTGGIGSQLEDCFFATVLTAVSLLRDERGEKISSQLRELVFSQTLSQHSVGVGGK